MDEFWRAVTLLESKDEVRAFFRDIITSTERVMLAKRLQIAKRLYNGDSYFSIKKELNVTAATIASVSRWLDSFGAGYRTVIPRLEAASHKKRLANAWRGNSGAKLLAGATALGASAIHKKIVASRKRRSAQLNQLV
ncbi:MAG: YerC/YecD family TrpR-related protein [Patescibacteria group bacterium]|nr:YerC/YecD family TrpR-related protein [Patescibacteria group bacterium]